MQKQYRDLLIDIYIDWRCNYLSVDVFAEHNGLHLQQAEDLISLARRVYNSEHPDA